MQTSTCDQSIRDDVAEKNRFESFKLGKGHSSNGSHKHKHMHSRSHSRNASVSFLSSPFSPFVVTAKPSPETASSVAITQSSSKRNSHHRRHSSVSTRVESAEMMGVSIPDLPCSSSDDNINLGGKDSIRRRALWALEGRPDVSFSKVEIPELSTPVMEKLMFDFKADNASNSISGHCLNQNPVVPNKRESFKLRPSSSSSKDQLDTLIEEDEDEEDGKKEMNSLESTSQRPLSSLNDSESVGAASTRLPVTAPHLRPLSLTPESLSNFSLGLPTPVTTPSPRPGLKSLTLTSSVVGEEHSTATGREGAKAVSTRRLSGKSEDNCNVKRRSSISYKTSSSATSGVVRNFTGLPTPEMTPTAFDRRFSQSISPIGGVTSEAGFYDHPTTQTRLLSANEQHFLFKSHDVLLARITDLERALSLGRKSSGGYSSSESPRPLSMASDSSSSKGFETGEPCDEMLRLVVDLKAERDELKRDVDGWRTRVTSMEKQLSLVARRVESERRDAWVARSMVGVLETEKQTLQKSLEHFDQVIRGMVSEKAMLMKENTQIMENVAFLDSEVVRLSSELSEAKAFACTNIPSANSYFCPGDSDVKYLPSPVVKVPKLSSADFECSNTVINGAINNKKPLTSSIPISKQNDPTIRSQDRSFDGDECADSDVSFKAPPALGHSRGTPCYVDTGSQDFENSLSKKWTFPIGVQSPPETQISNVEADRFFDCLQDDSVNESRPSQYSHETGKELFTSVLKNASKAELPFAFSLHDDAVHTLQEGNEDQISRSLASDEKLFEEAGGIQITFTAPQDDGFTSMRPRIGDEIRFPNCPSSTSAIPRLPSTKNSELPYKPSTHRSPQPSKGHTKYSFTNVHPTGPAKRGVTHSMIPQLVGTSVRTVPCSGNSFSGAVRLTSIRIPSSKFTSQIPTPRAYGSFCPIKEPSNILSVS